MEHQPCRIAAPDSVAVIDDDSSVRDTMALLLRMEGYTCHIFSDGQSFLDQFSTLSPSCIVLDLHLPDMSGIQVLQRLSLMHRSVPVIMMSGDSHVPVAVQSMKAGAIDFIEKPFTAAAMIHRITSVIVDHRKTTSSAIKGLGTFAGSRLLTERERDVLELLAYGASNKEAGRRLGISPRTIEVHRAHIMEKLGARNSADMMRIVLSGQSRALAGERM